MAALIVTGQGQWGDQRSLGFYRRCRFRVDTNVVAVAEMCNVLPGLLLNLTAVSALQTATARVRKFKIARTELFYNISHNRR